MGILRKDDFAGFPFLLPCIWKNLPVAGSVSVIIVFSHVKYVYLLRNSMKQRHFMIY